MALTRGVVRKGAVVEVSDVMVIHILLPIRFPFVEEDGEPSEELELAVMGSIVSSHCAGVSIDEERLWVYVSFEDQECDR